MMENATSGIIAIRQVRAIATRRSIGTVIKSARIIGIIEAASSLDRFGSAHN